MSTPLQKKVYTISFQHHQASKIFCHHTFSKRWTLNQTFLFIAKTLDFNPRVFLSQILDFKPSALDFKPTASFIVKTLDFNPSVFFIANLDFKPSALDFKPMASF